MSGYLIVAAVYFFLSASMMALAIALQTRAGFVRQHLMMSVFVAMIAATVCLPFLIAMFLNEMLESWRCP